MYKLLTSLNLSQVKLQFQISSKPFKQSFKLSLALRPRLVATENSSKLLLAIRLWMFNASRSFLVNFLHFNDFIL